MSNETYSDLPFDRVYVVSLPISTERRDHISRHLPEAGLHCFEFHDAICAKDEAVQQAFAESNVAVFPPCFRCGKSQCGDDYCNNVLIPTQVAVFLSHLSLWQKIAAGSACALVCEDDVVFHPWWREVMAMISRARDQNILKMEHDEPLCVRLGWAESLEHSQDEPFRLSREVRMSNPCYLLTSAYADMLLTEFNGIDHTADVFAHLTSKAAINFAWTAHPPR